MTKFSEELIPIFLIVILLKSLAWALIIPLWHFPDEQAHFGHVAYLAEGGTLPMGRTNDLTQEIAISEQRLGTYRNKYGNNSFTYHPEYRLEYSNSNDGLYENEIKTLPVSTRKEFKDPESAYYPHFFYRVSGLIYNLFYSQDIFVRVFALRIFWLFTHLLMVYWAYKIGQLVFPKSPLTAMSVAVLTSFQPMLSFVAAGVTSDSLHNALFTGVIYFAVKLFHRINWQDLLWLAGVFTFGMINKPQFLIAFAILIPVLLFSAIKFKKWSMLLFFGIALSFLSFVFGREYLSGLWDSLKLGQLPFLESRASQSRPEYTLWQHLIYTLEHTFSEVLPWYWGVFRWLSLTLPRWVNQVMMRLLVIAGIGLVIKLVRKKFEPGFWIIVWSVLIYFLALFFWDWQQIRNSGFPFGIQGRYYFPVIVPHMVLLVIGLRTIWSKLLILLNYWFILLNWIALYWVSASYYDSSNFKTFILQASQYKPDFAKDWWLISVLGLYFIGSLVLSVQLFKLWRNEK